MKFFDKTLDEIYDIVSDVNELIFSQVNTKNEFPSINITFEFGDWFALFKMDEQVLFSTENNDRERNEETGECEDIKLTLIRAINEQLNLYKKVKL